MARTEITALCAELAIGFKLVSLGLQGPTENWDQAHNAYKVTISRGRKRATIDFRTGTGWKVDPDLADVLSCMVSDASAGEASFDDFCSDFGYDSDSRKAHATWKACRKMSERLSRLLDSAEIERLREACQDF